MIKNILSCCFLLFAAFGLQAQTKGTEQALFRDGDNVNFIGNSITHGGEFHTNILLFYATRFPDRDVSFYNSGIWGDNANDILRRLDTDILPKNADWSVVMAGMNDVNRALYAPNRQQEPNLEAEKQRHLVNYRNYLEAVIKRLLASGTNVILQKPSIYDQTGRLPVENHLGVNDALQKAAAIVEQLAQKYNLKTVDYWSVMMAVNQRLQAMDATATVVSNDRIHPGTLGSFVMAYQFLKETGAPTYISKVRLEKQKVKESLNATVTALRADKKSVSFSLQQKSLPFPVPQEAEAALRLVPFIQEMNQELLQVACLKNGSYSLTIDTTLVGIFSAQQLAEGINLALYPNTPQYRQALRVRQLAEERRKVVKRLRDIRLVEVRYLPPAVWSAAMPAIETTMAAFLQELAQKNDRRLPGVQNYFEGYRKNKPQEKELKKQAEVLLEAIKEGSQPLPHKYQILPQKD